MSNIWMKAPLHWYSMPEPHAVLVMRLRELIPDRGQRRVADGAGVSENHLSEWMTGKRRANVTLDTLHGLSDALSVPIHALVSDDEDADVACANLKRERELDEREGRLRKTVEQLLASAAAALEGLPLPTGDYRRLVVRLEDDEGTG